MSKFYYIHESDLSDIHDLFAKKDPDKKVVLNEYGDWLDVATYAPKYKTVVFCTVKRDKMGRRF